MKIVAVGECTNDRYLDCGVDTVGGISLNFAVHAKLAGADSVALVSCLGTDPVAQRVLATVTAAGVDGSRIHQRPGRTASQAIQRLDGERVFPPGGYDPGVLTDFTLNDGDREFIAGFDVVAAPRFRQIGHLFDAAMAAATPAAFRVVDLLDGADLGGLEEVNSLLSSTDLVFISGGPATVDRLLPRSAASRAMIVVTLGADGAVALANGVAIAEPAVAVTDAERVDTTGCGDAFQAAFTVSFFADRNVRSALRAGTARAGLTIRHLGGVPGTLTR